ncbi:archaetidylserine decarboxylase [Estrella lausannensis]|uniref:phosphatidylserine decarboxylase n=1 Tax=Estrella lausannensis TaxID=483423 RepID=A0A0H5DSM4_9BACT|nr:archaetidylserine decarboxylase [Estrella lausannensis]CRX38789.1 Phosphatidylserine decarboxylase proenzyme [Estrella lausannensis]
MTPIFYINRETGKREKEEVFGERAISFLYGGSKAGSFIQNLVSKIPLFSTLYGCLQSSALSKGKVTAFIDKYGVNTTEFEKAPQEFQSFNDFFTRKLKKEARPISEGDNVAIIPADGRFLFYSNISEEKNFIVKGKQFDLKSFLNDEALAKEYEGGALVLGRLCPVDYHRFHFPVSGVAESPKLINGPLFSVNPFAVRQNINILFENKRYVTKIETTAFQQVLLVEIGATFVGKVVSTFSPGKPVEKGDEKGYFSFGGSAVALLFKRGTLLIEKDLLQGTEEGLEVLCKMGQPLGKAAPE